MVFSLFKPPGRVTNHHPPTSPLHPHHDSHLHLHLPISISCQPLPLPPAICRPLIPAFNVFSANSSSQLSKALTLISITTSLSTATQPDPTLAVHTKPAIRSPLSAISVLMRLARSKFAGIRTRCARPMGFSGRSQSQWYVTSLLSFPPCTRNQC